MAAQEVSREKVYATIARSLREFGYPDVTPEMVSDTHAAMERGEDLPHGVIGMFAQRQLQDLIDEGWAPNLVQMTHEEHRAYHERRRPT